MTSRKRKNFTLAEKAEIVKQFNAFQGTKVAFAQSQGIPVTTLQSILQKKERIENDIKKVGEKNSKKRKTLKKSPYDKLEGILVQWYKEARAANVPINGTILREKALEIADKLGGLKDFTASNGWIDRMKKRHNLMYKSLSGESSSVDEATIEEFMRNLPENLAICEAGRATAPSVAGLLDFSPSNENQLALPIPSFDITMLSLQILKDYFLSLKDHE